jgi:hypothetical protein
MLINKHMNELDTKLETKLLCFQQVTEDNIYCLCILVPSMVVEVSRRKIASL